MAGHEHPEHGRPKGLRVIDPGTPPAPGPVAAAGPAPALGKDPVCGMMVPLDAPLRSTFEGQTYVFCNARCRERFEQDPRRYLAAGMASEPMAEPAPDNP